MWPNLYHKRCEVLCLVEGNFYMGFKNPLTSKPPLKNRKENHLSHCNIKAISLLRKAKMHSSI